MTTLNFEFDGYRGSWATIGHWLGLSCWIWFASCAGLPGPAGLADRKGRHLNERLRVWPAPAHGLAISLPGAVTATALVLHKPRVVISEVLVDPLLRAEGVGEYLELVNLSPSAVRLIDLTFVLPSGKRVTLDRSSASVLRVGEVGVVRPQPRADEIGGKGLRLPNDAGRLELWWRNELIDTVQWHTKRRRVHAGIALERLDPRSDGANPHSWRRAIARVDKLERGSPGYIIWPCAALTGTTLASACGSAVASQPRAKTTRGRNLCGSGPVVGRWGGT